MPPVSADSQACTLPASQTAAVGNTHILSATSTISTKLGLRVLCRKMCGSRDKAAARADKPCDDLDWKLSEEDSSETVELQWHRLWRAFDDPDSVLLVHCRCLAAPSRGTIPTAHAACYKKCHWSPCCQLIAHLPIPAPHLQIGTTMLSSSACASGGTPPRERATARS